VKPLLTFFAVKKVEGGCPATTLTQPYHFRPMAAVMNVKSISCFANILVPATLAADDIDNTNSLAAV
jgi:hypothetical protein